MITADLDQQLHGWSIDAIDNYDGCAVFLQKLEEHPVWEQTVHSMRTYVFDGSSRIDEISHHNPVAHVNELAIAL